MKSLRTMHPKDTLPEIFDSPLAHSRAGKRRRTHRFSGGSGTGIETSAIYTRQSQGRNVRRASLFQSCGGGPQRGARREYIVYQEYTFPVDLRRLLDANLSAREVWPFCFPYGKRDSFNASSVRTLQQLGFHCAFTTESGVNRPGIDLFAINRVDCKNAPAGQSGTVQ